MRRLFPGVVAVLLVLSLSGHLLAAPPQSVEAILASSPPASTIKEKLARFAVAPIEIDIKKINKAYLRSIAKLIEAADAIDRIFWQQVSEDGIYIYEQLLRHDSPKAKMLAELMSIHYGPWDRLEGNEPFIGTRPKPPGAAFYPADASLRELQLWLQNHPETRAEILSPYTVVRRKGSGFIAIPYSKMYRADLKKAASALREAALLCPCKSLKEFLKERADAFLTDDYYKSDLLWMDSADCPLIVVIGPYEFYEDLLWGAKTSFEAILAWRNDKETERFKRLAGMAENVMAELPLPEGLKSRLIVTKQRPITIADEIYTAGEARAGAQTTAFTLPNDPRVRKEKGTRQVILRNVAMAKFNHSWIPLTRRVVAEEQIVYVTFDSYFDQLIATELARAIIPAPVKLPDGTVVNAAARLRQRYHVIEEAKSDALGLHILYWLTDKGLLPQRDPAAHAATFLTAIFRVIRFDTAGAHGLAKAILFNYFARRGAIQYDPTTKRYRVDPDKFREVLPDLLKTLFQILADGDYDGAGRLIVDYGILPADVRAKLADLRDVPVDIKPMYPIKKQLPME